MEVLNMFKVSAVPPRRYAVLTVFHDATAINDGTTAVYAIQAPQWHLASSVTGVLQKMIDAFFPYTVFDLISGLSAYVILGKKNRPN